MRNPFERLGSTDPRAERQAEKAQREILDDVESELGVDGLKNLLHKVTSDPTLKSLTDNERTALQKIRDERGGIRH